MTTLASTQYLACVEDKARMEDSSAVRIPTRVTKMSSLGFNFLINMSNEEPKGRFG